MKHSIRFMLLALLLFYICAGCSSRKESDPDVLSCFSMNRDENLVVIANRNEIKDKKEFARQLVRMCKAVYAYICPVCKKEFSVYGNANRKYCSHQCYVAGRFGGVGNE